MQSEIWEPIEDNRFKYSQNETKWYKVSIERTANCPFKDRSAKNYCVLTDRLKAYIQPTLSYDVRSDDVWISSYPRSGTTWVQEMVWLINNDYDFQTASSTPLVVRSPTLRQVLSDKVEVAQMENDVSKTYLFGKNFEPPFHFKTHLPVAFLPDKLWTVKPKIIYVARNPKDTAVSFYHYYKLAYGYDGTKKEFLNLFLEGLTEFGLQTSHIIDFWNLRNEENVLFLTFEEMKKDLRKAIKTVADFLEKSINDVQLEQLFEYLQFNAMRDRVGVIFDLKSFPEIAATKVSQEFFRQGSTGSYKDEMDPEIIKKFDDLINSELTMKGCDIYI